jgi:hypothetical protein
MEDIFAIVGNRVQKQGVAGFDARGERWAQERPVSAFPTSPELSYWGFRSIPGRTGELSRMPGVKAQDMAGDIAAPCPDAPE